MSIIRIGADPEVFIVDKNGSFVPACGIVPGTKDNPFRVERGALQVDGVAAEFNIDPAENADQFSGNIQTVLNQLLEFIKKADKDLDIMFSPIARFTKDVWNTVSNDSKVLGCDPDYNVNGEVNVNPTELLADEPIRTAAGHIHIGFTEVDSPTASYHMADCNYIANGFFRSHLSTFVPSTQDELERLKYYGHNGSWRPKKYGIELRAPSNRWVKTHESRQLAYNQVRSTFKTLTGL